MPPTSPLARLSTLDTNTVSDALDFLNLAGATFGILPLWDCPKIVGRASTAPAVQMAGVTVNEDDFAIADRCGSVFVPAACIDEVLDLAERIARQQDGRVAAVRAGQSVAEVMHDKKFDAIRSI